MILLKTRTPPWPRETEDVVVALEGFDAVLELFAPEVGLLELALLDHGAHGTVQHQDPPGQRRNQVLGPL